MKKSIALLALLLLASLNAAAQLQESIKNFTKDIYGAGAQNWQISQQRNGIIYVANMNALLRFDGIGWTRIEVPGCGNNLRAVHISQNGDVYVGGYNLFGVFKAGDGGLGSFTDLTALLDEGERNFDEIWNINSIGEKIIFQTYEELFVYENGKLNAISSGGRQMMYSTVIDNDLYIATRYEGIFTLSDDVLAPASYGADFRGKVVCHIEKWNDKTFFVTQDDGIYVYEPWAGISRYQSTVNDEISRNQAFTADICGNSMAIGTVQNGLYILNLVNDGWRNINTKTGLQNNTVLSICHDANEDLYVGLDRGIDFINLNSPFKSLFTQKNSFGTGYCSLLAGSTLYLGTNQGLFYTTYKGGDIGEINKIPGTEGQVYKMVQIDNKLYCCHHNGLYEISGGTARKVLNIEGIWTLQRLQKNPNYLIAGSYNGLVVMKKNGGGLSLHARVSGFAESSRLFEQDENGTIWVSHGLRGIYKIALSQDLTTAESVSFYGEKNGFGSNLHISVYKIDDKIIFAAEDRLYSYDESKDRMVPNDTLIKSDDYSNYLYFKKFNNQLAYLKGDLIGYFDNNADGTYGFNASNSFNIPEELIFEYFSLTQLDDDYLLASNEDGFTMVNLQLLFRNSLHDVYIRRIITNRDNALRAEQYFKTTEQNQSVEIPYSDNSLEIFFSTVSYSDKRNKQTKYSYMLSGYDENWSLPSCDDRAVYSDLPRGSYSFQVKTFNRSNESSIASFDITILPPWYATIWAYIGYIVIFIVIILLINRYVRHREKVLEKQSQIKIDEQKEIYEKEKSEKERQLMELKNSYLEEELKSKGNELASSTMNLIRKNEILIDIKDEIQKIISSGASSDESRQTNKKLEKIIRNINENIEHDDDWSKFEKEFDAINQNFIRRLSEQYKGLTVNDKKLCAYLKMNLVSKDIAPLMNISVRGVEISRYRLRKKLNLDRETNLTEFLQNF